MIEAAELPFGPGLNVITGETGAGKSLVVGALELLVGLRHKAGAKVVRAGAAAARVEGRFELVAGSERARVVRAYLERELPELVEEFDESVGDGHVHELILGRTITKDGRSRAHVGQRPASLKSLAGVAGLLFEIHGQNDHQRLLQRDEQLALLDGFAGAREDLTAYRAARKAWRGLRDELVRFEAERAERRDRLDLLRFQFGELDEAGLQAGEAARLNDERERLSHAEALSMELGGVAMGLSESDDALLDTLRQMERRVEAWRKRINGLEDAANNLREAVVFAEEAAVALVSFTSDLEVDPARLEEVEERTDELERLQDKYGCDEAGLIALCAELGAGIDELEALESSSGALESRVAEARAAMEARAAKLTAKRKAAMKPLSKAVEGALAGLGLAKARFSMVFVAEGTAAKDKAPAKAETAVTTQANAAATTSQGAAKPAAHKAANAASSRAASDASPQSGKVDSAKANGAASQGAARSGAASFTSHGVEGVEFLLAANPGEPPASLATVASGGEAARIMLALESVLAANETGRCLVFDEVDTGVGGRLGPEVAARLRELGENHQVLCVTHLPAIAAGAHRHLRVAKETRSGRTVTVFAELAGEPRVRELADMIAGGADEATARAEAGRLLAALA